MGEDIESGDEEIQCIDCPTKFWFYQKDKEFYQKMVEEGKMEQFNKPKRCKPCRVKKKARFAGTGERVREELRQDTQDAEEDSDYQKL